MNPWLQIQVPFVGLHTPLEEHPGLQAAVPSLKKFQESIK